MCKQIHKKFVANCTIQEVSFPLYKLACEFVNTFLNGVAWVDYATVECSNKLASFGTRCAGTPGCSFNGRKYKTLDANVITKNLLKQVAKAVGETATCEHSEDFSFLKASTSLKDALKSSPLFHWFNGLSLKIVIECLQVNAATAKSYLPQNGQGSLLKASKCESCQAPIITRVFLLFENTWDSANGATTGRVPQPIRDSPTTSLQSFKGLRSVINTNSISSPHTQTNRTEDNIPLQDKVMYFVQTGKSSEDQSRINTKLSNILRLPPSKEFTGGYRVLDMPANEKAWRRVTYLIVPKVSKGRCAVDRYDSKLLCSLAANVVILHEEVLDFVLGLEQNGWPARSDRFYGRFERRYESRWWPNKQRRMQYAAEGLFDSTEFAICGSPGNPQIHLCGLLVRLCRGKIVTSLTHAEYVVFTDTSTLAAQEALKTLKKNDEELVSATHGARHSNPVTPKFIFDCIKGTTIQRPCADRGHIPTY